MSRRDREVHDSHGKRLRSRFDREPSPKKLKKDEKSEASLARASNRHWSMVETTGDKRQRSVRDDTPLEAPVSSTPANFQKEKKSLERKGDMPLVVTHHSTDNKEVPRLRTFYQHDDRSSTGQGGQQLNRRPTDHRRWNDRAREVVNDLPKKADRLQSHVFDEKTTVWRHDRFYAIESGPPPSRKRPAFREKKMPSEPETDSGAMGTEKTKPSTRQQAELAAEKRVERARFYPRALDKRERWGDGFYHRGETQRNLDVDQPREVNVGMRGWSDRDRLNVRHSERELNRVGSFEVEKWKHDLFDETNQNSPPKNEEDQIAKVEALLAL